jgi:hypothetical protein
MLTTKLKKLICLKVLESDVLHLLVANGYLTDVNDMESLTSKAEQALANKKVKVELSHHLFDKLIALWPDMTKNTYSATNAQFNLYVNSHDYMPLTDDEIIAAAKHYLANTQPMYIGQLKYFFFKEGESRCMLRHLQIKNKPVTKEFQPR